jgi:hypothetical protein
VRDVVWLSALALAARNQMINADGQQVRCSSSSCCGC